MEVKYLLDTNFVIYYLANREDCILIFKEIVSHNPIIFISPISVSELFSFDKLKEKDFLEIDAFLKELSILNVDSNVAKESGKIRSKTKIKTPDALIAGTAILYDLVLLTENHKDFKKIDGLRIRKF